MRKLTLAETHNIHGGVILVLTTLGVLGAASVSWNLMYPQPEAVDTSDNAFVCPPCELGKL